jgi:hypothetical protein
MSLTDFPFRSQYAVMSFEKGVVRLILKKTSLWSASTTFSYARASEAYSAECGYVDEFATLFFLLFGHIVSHVARVCVGVS